ncbi:ferrochelatase [Myxococcota bacterium]|nr:ferrochelatase [Myxococcota bacterium]
MSSPRIGILIVNLGTPDSPKVQDVRRYLREFLGDPRVLDMSPIARWFLLNLIILPFRPRRSAHAYEQIWQPKGSPLLIHGQELATALARELGGSFKVELAMRYGKPGIRKGLESLCGSGVERVIALPLFPQYSESVTGSINAKLREEHERLHSPPPLQILGSFCEEPGFIAAWAAVAGPALASFEPDHVVLSFHGLPERQILAWDKTGTHCLQSSDCCDSLGSKNRGCYRAECFATARAMSRELGLAPEHHDVSFQSRLLRDPWIRPYTDEVLTELAGRGVRRLAVLCPAFVADCLETVEEIGIRGREQWSQLGGEELLLVPSLNAEPRWVEALADQLRSAAT